MCTKMIFTRHIRTKVTFGSVVSGQPCSPRWVDRIQIRRIRIRPKKKGANPVDPVDRDPDPTNRTCPRPSGVVPQKFFFLLSLKQTSFTGGWGEPRLKSTDTVHLHTHACDFCRPANQAVFISEGWGSQYVIRMFVSGTRHFF